MSRRTESSNSANRTALPAAFASVMGWAFDLFDLFLLLYVAGPVGKVIFPQGSETFSLALVFVSFAVSILMRPGGAALFGSFADRLGRRRVMVVVLLGVGLSTAAMGAVPAYATAGAIAPVIFLILRVIQGLFVGGVSAVTHTLGTESVPPRWRGLMSGLVGGGGAGIGAAMASIAYIVIGQLFPGERFNEVGWRWMFATGLLGALLSFFVLRKVEESPVWLETQARAAAAPKAQQLTLKQLLRGPLGVVTLVNIVIAAGGGAQYYLTSGFLPTYLGVVTKIPTTERGWVLLSASVLSVVGATLAGELSERWGRRRTMLVVGAVNLVAIPTLLIVLARIPSSSLWTAVLLSSLIAFLANAVYAPVLIFLNERYPTAIRARGTAISWNTGFMLGGLLPTFVTLASPTTADIPSRLVVFVVASVLVFLVAVWRAPETRGRIEEEERQAVADLARQAEPDPSEPESERPAGPDR